MKEGHENIIHSLTKPCRVFLTKLYLRVASVLMSDEEISSGEERRSVDVT